MLDCALQGYIDANSSEVLDFLERTSRWTYPDRDEPGVIKGIESEFRIEVERGGNVISIHAKPCASDTQSSEIIRFEVKQSTRSMSLIKGCYDSQGPRFILMFYRIWTRLAIAFGAPFAGEAFRKLRELEPSGSTAEFGEGKGTPSSKYDKDYPNS